jgi:hypothetical protein
MAEWTEEQKENCAARREIRVGECAEALVLLLKEEGKRWKGRPIEKRILCPRLPKIVKDNRLKSSGALEIPTVNNRIVRPPDLRFVMANWSAIVLYAAQHLEKYVIFNHEGIRLGTLDEFKAQQENFRSIYGGIGDRHNLRAEIINERGLQTAYLSEPALELPAPRINA